jgi:hypothetical protein
LFPAGRIELGPRVDFAINASVMDVEIKMVAKMTVVRGALQKNGHDHRHAGKNVNGHKNGEHDRLSTRLKRGPESGGL